jgi:hypothetical protein
MHRHEYRAMRVTRGTYDKDVSMLIYKVVEIGTVTEDVIEETLNSWSSKGWMFDGLQFAMRESSKRPAMAFALFTQEVPCEEEKHD